MKTRRRFGQHFLADDNIINEIVMRIRPRKGEKILEIGPGKGALSAGLLQAGAKLMAVEIDRDLAAELQAQFGDSIDLITGDILKQNLPQLVSENSRVAGNLPYNISTPLLLKLCECRTRGMWLMVQEEVAARICAPTGTSEYGRLTVSVRLFYQASYEIHVPPSAFVPPPKVDSAMIQLTPRIASPMFSPLFSEITAAAFQSRRKMLGNGLSGFNIAWKRAGIEPSRRPQTVSPDEFARLSLCAEKR